MNILYHSVDEYLDIMKNSKKNIILIPIGCIENHGHLPLGTDSLIATRLGEDIMVDNQNVILTPTINYGCHSLPDSGGGFHMPGSICMDNITFIQHLEKVVESYYNDGHCNFMLLNCHFENSSFLSDVITRFYKKYNNIVSKDNNIKMFNVSYWELSSKETIDIVFPEGFNPKMEHAGIAETSIIMYLYPELVKSFDHINIKESNKYCYEFFDFNKIKEEKKDKDMKYATLASPVGSSAEKGKILWDEFLVKINEIIKSHF